MQAQKNQSQQIVCPRCGAPMVLRNGRYGKFYGCTNYPQCEGTRDYETPYYRDRANTPSDTWCSTCGEQMEYSRNGGLYCPVCGHTESI